jgi:hypothetical protein
MPFCLGPGGSVSMQSLRRWRVSRLVRATVVILQTCLLVCSTSLQKKFGAQDNAPDGTTTALRNADFSARSPIGAGEAPDRPAPDHQNPRVVLGADPESPPHRSRDSDYGVRSASSDPVTVRGDDVEINFEGTDIASAAKVVLGDVLHLIRRSRAP